MYWFKPINFWDNFIFFHKTFEEVLEFFSLCKFSYFFKKLEIFSKFVILKPKKKPGYNLYHFLVRFTYGVKKYKFFLRNL